MALADGTEITTPVVVSNINAKTLYLDLIGKEHLPPGWRATASRATRSPYPRP
ncbi:MAG: hypothetical protein SWK76_10745 [Actinomycetota bacterium]|nr:hypothetical protein [Actinomycetota bacterium]